MNTKYLCVQELNKKEKKNINAGGWAPFIVGYLLIEALMNPEAHINAMMEGYNS